ncbi:MAG: DUF4190 domain-containing protein [Candidatus Nanopelagicales bacterium]
MSDPNQPADGDPFAPPPADGSGGIPGIPGDTPPPPPPAPAYGTPPPPPPAVPAYGAPAYGAPQPAYAAAAPQNGPGTTALVTGILGLLCCGILAIVAIIQGRKGIALADQGLATNRGSAQAGMILGWIGVALWALSIVGYGILFATGAISGSASLGS